MIRVLKTEKTVIIMDCLILPIDSPISETLILLQRQTMYIYFLPSRLSLSPRKISPSFWIHHTHVLLVIPEPIQTQNNVKFKTAINLETRLISIKFLLSHDPRDVPYQIIQNLTFAKKIHLGEITRLLIIGD